jgi:transitional endoplasmic reticulum ATPase
VAAARMTDSTLSGLMAALAATPQNVELRLVVVRLLAEQGRDAEAAGVAEPLDAAAVARAADRRTLAEVQRRAGRLGAALALLEHDTEAETLLLKARVLAALERTDEARRAYEAAITANAALEDPELKRAVHTNIRVFGRDGAPPLKVIANDDTDDADVLRLLAPSGDKVAFKDIGGLDDVKKTIHRRIVLPFQKPSLFQRFKKRAGGGILFYGPPGCGKTLLARATAGEVDATFYSVSIADVLDMYIGESERKLQAIFAQARQKSPAVLFFDEIEALGGKRQYSREGTSAKIVSQFLAEMDGFAQNNHGVLVLAATNVPWAVDPAFRRPGRFDRVVFIPPPDEEARRAILTLLLEARPVARDIDVRYLALHTSGFSGADLRELIETGVDEAIEESIAEGREVELAMEHLKTALKERRPTTIEWLTTARNYARYSNESGQYDEVLAFLDKHGR